MNANPKNFIQNNKPLRVALLGCGVVGSQVARLLIQDGEDLRARIGRPLELVGVAVRDLNINRPGLDPKLFTDDALGLVSKGDLDLVIELIGGIEPAKTLLLSAIKHGASVVTANKALLAEDLETLSKAAEEEGVDLHFEASVAGAIPIIRPLRESLVGDEITAVMGIVNGTTNYILDKMTSYGMSFNQALSKAQEFGFAEADPTADVEGFDAAAKAAILAGLAFHTRVTSKDVYREGITGVTEKDIAAAKRLGCNIKLLASAKLTDEETPRVSVKVHPTMVPFSHPLATVPGAYNAIFVESREAGRLMFLGKGAGGSPTASAVMGDVVTVCRNRARGVTAYGQSVYARREIAPMADSKSRYYLRFLVSDKPGVLAASSAIFAKYNISLHTVQQSAPEDENGSSKNLATLDIMTHEAKENDLLAVLNDLKAADFVSDSVHFVRVEGD